MKREDIHHIIYVILLVFMAGSLPLSNYMMSMAGIFLSANWIAEWNWKEKWNRLKNNKLAIVLAAFPILFLFSLAQTDNMASGWNNVLSKLPMLYAPLVMATEKKLSGRELRIVLNGFVVCVFVATLLCIGALIFNDIQDFREMSLFISHIRFGFLILLAIMFCLLFAFKAEHYNSLLRCAYAGVALWFVFYLFIAQTVTAIMILLAGVCVFALYLLLGQKEFRGRKVLLTLCLLAFIGAGSHIAYVTYHYFHHQEPATLPAMTAAGHAYTHDMQSMVENGSLIGLYVCEEELRAAWTERSLVPYPEVSETLIRYLNSKGLRKDAEGVAALTEADLDNVENGVANVAYTEVFGIHRALYPTFFSWTLYQKKGAVANSSLLQRVELWRAASAVFARHFWTGVGAGDNKAEINAELAARHSEVRPDMGAHNQFLTLGLMGGIFLLLLFLFTLLAPFIVKGGNINIYYVLFFMMIFLSCLTEDTIETEAGMTLYAFFNSFLLFDFDLQKMFNHHNL